MTGQPSLVASQDALASLVDHLRGSPLLAFDTEAASFHRYFDRVYLIQVSTPVRNAIIDPLSVPDLAPIGAVLNDPSVQVIFHDADYDLRSLDRDFGFRVRNIFDTRIAAQLLGEPEIGLGALLTKHFGIKLNKKLQRADWSQRPLTPEMIAYAAADTSHLAQLKEIMEGQLRTAGRLDWATEEFARLESIRVSKPEPDEAYLRLKGASTMQPRNLAVLRAVHAWREEEARGLDRATFRICGNETLLALAANAPTTRADMEKLKDVPPPIARRYGDKFLAAIQGALALPPADWPKIERKRGGPRYDPAIDVRLDRLKAMRNTRAQELGLQPGVLCPNGTLEAIARAPLSDAGGLTAVSEMRKWQLAALGPDRIFAAWSSPTNQSPR